MEYCWEQYDSPTESSPFTILSALREPVLSSPHLWYSLFVMKEQTPENQPTEILDDSASAMPHWLTNAYESMNDSIASQHAAFGLTLQQEHLLRSRNAIRTTAQVALRQSVAGEERTALILGPGGCFDIPLEEIASDFDAVTLVDVDTTQTERALDELPARLLGKMTLIKGDITRNVSKLAAIVEDSSERDYAAFIKQSSEKIAALTLEEQQQAIKGAYSFVCSQLVMSQLCSIPFLRFSELVEEKYGRPLTMQFGYEDAPLVRSLNDYNFASHDAHMRHLAEYTKPAGTAHFADTVIEAKYGQRLPMISQDSLDVMASHFDAISEPQVWNWTPGPSRLFWVMAHSLAPKAS